jgi:hypothetical protein
MPKFGYRVKYESFEDYEIEAESEDHVESEISNGNEGTLIERESYPGDIVEIWEIEDA